MTQSVLTSFVENRLIAMTLAEKIGQLTMVRPTYVEGNTDEITAEQHEAIRQGRIGSMLDIWGAERTRNIQTIAITESRLKVPLLFAHDILHGCETIFPVPLGEAATFDFALWEKTARAAAVETAAEGVALTFAPMLDVARDPRWGRIVESPGEDPWLACRFAEAKVRGFQQASLAKAPAIGATAKHLGAYGAVRAGREYASVDVSERTLHEVHLPAFSAAVKANVAAIMPAFVDIAGVPMTANTAILQDVVRERWGFDGVMISDFGAVAELISHGVAHDLAEAAALALRAGVDIDLASNAYPQGLPVALERGLVNEAQIDTAVRRVLTLKAKLGLFDDANRANPAPALTEHRALAREAASRSMVLLQDDDELVPLQSNAPHHMAVIGPLASTPEYMLGPWAALGQAEETVDFLTGLKEALPDWRITHASGGDVENASPSDLEAAAQIAKTADLTLLCLGEAPHMCGEAGSRADPGLPTCQRQLCEAVFASGKPVIVTLTCGRPLIAPWLFEKASTVLVTWFPGSKAGHALADILTGKKLPSGKLPITWPAHVGQIPIFFAQSPTGRPADPAERLTSRYLDVSVEPQFPFGHSLNCTKVIYDNLRVSPEIVYPGENVACEVDIVNEGHHQIEETAFLFIRDPVATITRPLLELRAAQKVLLAAGERTTLKFFISIDDLAFPNPNGAPCLEAGTFEVLIGPTADRKTLLKTTIRLP
jgi:beta-glucosidase